jgi:hypothetical protein
MITLEQETSTLTSFPRWSERWWPIPDKVRNQPQIAAWMNSRARFNDVAAGRRSYKTEHEKRKLVIGADWWLDLNDPDDVAFQEMFNPNADPNRIYHFDTDGKVIGGHWPGSLTLPRGNFAFLAPTHDQAYRIAWQDLKDMTEPFWTRDPHESQRRIYLPGDTNLFVLGMDKPKRIEGIPWNGLGWDEYADSKPEAWTLHVRPALTGMYDVGAWCDKIGVPEGRNHFYSECMKSKKDITGNRAHFTWESADVLPPEEIEAAKADMTDREFDQEYRAHFLGGGRLVYYTFGAHNISRLPFSTTATTYLCFDFNATVKPFALIVIQETPYGYHAVKEFVHQYTQTETACAMCNEWLIEKGFQGQIKIRGDYSGTAIKSSATVSDYNIVESVFKNRPGFAIGTRPTRDIRNRIKAQNRLMQTANGTVRWTVHPEECPKLVEDFEQTEWKDNERELDDSNSQRTHPTDAASYLAHYDHPTDRKDVIAHQR